MWMLMRLAGAGTNSEGVDQVLLPTDPRLLDLTDEQVAWLFDKFQDEWPDKFETKYVDPDFDEYWDSIMGEEPVQQELALEEMEFFEVEEGGE
jgi:hypothetical protein